MHQGGIVQDRNGDLEGRNDSQDLSSIVDGIAQDGEEGELPLIEGLPGFLSTQTRRTKVSVKRCSSAVGSVADKTIGR